ncbi:DNA alkylation repair protein [Paenibacillus sp. UMB4589-SE434]|uniref:DNA alkylation repair protein n=1 Tax=Paenibacillus sp. UMB4589-SE434 TaxID=3046314 RepID=UPI00254AF62B|nr:DNA alkylation repair protein [Paenibacillus sp. UMB4589-SE434]MDK8183223.1 DNA alkylation repair protein [Paenibacillus sp. UMB4589-SE434]
MSELRKQIFGDSFFRPLITHLTDAYPKFDGERFLSLVQDTDWEERELKQRVRHVSGVLRKTLPDSYEEAIEVLMEIAPLGSGLAYITFPDFVEVYGQEHWDVSIRALERFTPYSTSEFAVRPFIERDQPRMMAQMLKWASQSNEHVRRLASEGCRPRLPWAMALRELKRNPEPILPILELLKEDDSLYVRKSVANNINDITKDHPALVRQLSAAWIGRHPHTDWIIRHGARTLLKRGDEEMLQLFGYKGHLPVHVEELELSADKLLLGERLRFQFNIVNESIELEKLRIEYGVEYVKANGSRSLKKFQLSDKLYPPGRTKVTREQEFRDLSTRKHHAGEHIVSVWVNGERKQEATFMLELV